MDELGEVKGKLQTVFFIGVSAKDGIAQSLRTFFDTLRERNINRGDHLRTELKSLQGKYFKDEGTFMLNAKSRNNSGQMDFINIGVDNKELKEFRKTCKEYGVDILFIKRPENLEELYHRQLKGEKLSSSQKQIVDAFTIKDDKGRSYLKDDTSIICFDSRDMAVVERVLDKMETKTQNIKDRVMRAQRAKENAKKTAQKTKDKIKHAVTRDK